MRVKISLLAILILAICSSLFAGDVYDKTVYVRETKTQLIYYGTVAFGTADSSDNHFTQFFQIDDCNSDHAYIWAKCSAEGGTEDVNVIVHYSANTDTSIVSSLNSGVIIDSLTTVPVCDTIDVRTGVSDTYFEGARFMRINFDGQNNQTTVTWYAVFKKNDPEVGAEKQILNHKP